MTSTLVSSSKSLEEEQAAAPVVSIKEVCSMTTGNSLSQILVFRKGGIKVKHYIIMRL